MRKWRKQTGVLIVGYEAYERLTKTAEKDKLPLLTEALVDPG